MNIFNTHHTWRSFIMQGIFKEFFDKFNSKMSWTTQSWNIWKTEFITVTTARLISDDWRKGRHINKFSSQIEEKYILIIPRQFINIFLIIYSYVGILFWNTGSKFVFYELSWNLQNIFEVKIKNENNADKADRNELMKTNQKKT